MRTIEAVREDLKERVREPWKFDHPPPFMKDIPESEISAEDTALWHQAEQRWLDQQANDDRRWIDRLDRRSRWIVGLVIAVALFAIWRGSR